MTSPIVENIRTVPLIIERNRIPMDIDETVSLRLKKIPCVIKSIAFEMYKNLIALIHNFFKIIYM